MAVRREVVSLSQLLQRRNSARREGSISLSQPSESNNRGNTPLSSAVAKHINILATAPSSTGWNPFKESRPLREELHGLALRQQSRLPPRDSAERSTGLQGIQSLLSSQMSLSQSDAGRHFSLSQEAPEDSWNECMTSQSQSQTFMPQPSYQARKASSDIAYRQSQPLSQSNTFPKVHASGNRSTVATSERGQNEEDTISGIVAPITASLNDVKTMLIEESAKTRKRIEAEEHIRDDVRSLKKTVERLHDFAQNTKQDCEGCHEKIAKEAAAAKCAFESMGARMGVMEKNVESFISNMSQFVRDELFALHVEKEKTLTTRKPTPLKQVLRPATKRRLMNDTPSARRYGRTSSSTKSRGAEREQTPRARRATAGDATTVLRRSIRIETLRTKKADKSAAEDDKDDQFGMRLALERVEEARAKRRQQLRASATPDT